MTITMGDGMLTTPPRENMGVYLEGVQVDTVTTQPGEYVTVTYQVTVSDGQLNLAFEDLGGEGQFVIINSIEVNSAELLDHGTTAIDEVASNPNRLGEIMNLK